MATSENGHKSRDTAECVKEDTPPASVSEPSAAKQVEDIDSVEMEELVMDGGIRGCDAIIEANMVMEPGLQGHQATMERPDDY